MRAARDALALVFAGAALASIWIGACQTYGAHDPTTPRYDLERMFR